MTSSTSTFTPASSKSSLGKLCLLCTVSFLFTHTLFSILKKTVAIGDASESGFIKVYSKETSSITFQAHASYITRIRQSPFNESLVGTVSNDNTSKIWDISSNSLCWVLLRTFTGHTAAVSGLEFINSDTIATGSFDQKIQIWSSSTGSTIRTISSGATIYALQMLKINDGLYLAASLQNSFIRIYNYSSGTLFKTLVGHGSNVFDLALLGDGSLLASSGNDLKVRIWNLTSFSSVFNLTGHVNNVYGLKKISSEILASGSLDKTIKLWNITDGSLIMTLSNHTNQILFSLDMLNDDLISGSYDQTMKFWNYKTGLLKDTISAGFPIRSLAVLSLTSLTSKFYFASLFPI